MTIRNPIEWSADNIRTTGHALSAAWRSDDVDPRAAPPVIRQIAMPDIVAALKAGWQDFLAYRTDVIFICFIYPLAGLVAARVSLDYNQLPLLFPFVSGFALIGPCAAAGLYQMSRLRAEGQAVSWRDAFAVFGSPRIGALVKLSLVLTSIYLVRLGVAMGIYHLTLGPEMPATIGAFVSDVFTTGRGFALIVLGVGIGALFALLVLALGAISFPMLVDRRVSVPTAVAASIEAMRRNKAVMLTWGAIVAVSLMLGALPLLLGLIIVVPVLGHATWHLYRRVVA